MGELAERSDAERRKLPRTLGVAPDIGAFEFPPVPRVALAAASGVTATTATLNATVNPQGLPVTYQFHYGTTAGLA